MKRAEMVEIVKTYCDVCGKHITWETHYGQDGKDYCMDHRPWESPRKTHALEEIGRQPFVRPRRGNRLATYKK